MIFFGYRLMIKEFEIINLYKKEINGSKETNSSGVQDQGLRALGENYIL